MNRPILATEVPLRPRWAEIPPGLAFSLAYLPARLAAVDATRALLSRLSNDAAVDRDPELKHVVEFAAKAVQIGRKIAVGTVDEAFRQAPSVTLPPLPANGDGWPAWRVSMETAIGARVDGGGRLGLGLGRCAFDLVFAWSRAERIAYFRTARANHPGLVEEATRCVPEIAVTWAALDRAIRDSGRPLLETVRVLLARNMMRAPAADAVTSPTWSGGAFAHMAHWLEHFETLLSSLGRHLDVPIDAPPTGPATPEEQQVEAAILANPDDDSLRKRFADLAAMRGDPRAELVRVQLAALSDAASKHAYRARELVDSHPEWSAPLTALGARDVEFSRGFPSEITIDRDALLANAARLFVLAPITTVRVRGGLAGHGAKLAALPQLAQLFELDLTSQQVTDKDLEVLLRSGRLERLRTLDLHQNEITGAGVEALAAATGAMPALTRVNLQLNRTSDPVDQLEFYDELNQHYVSTGMGRALESKYGRLRWLHPGD